MRTSRMMLTVFSLAVLTNLLFDSFEDIAFGRARDNRGPVTVTVDRSAYPVATPVVVKVGNTSGRPVSLPGCANVTLQQYNEERDSFIPLAPKRCEWEGNAVTVPPGDRTFQFEPSHSARAILRAVVTYGIGCREGVPLSQARCSSIETAYSHTFVVLEAPKK